ncbi:MAG: hypothetical protein WD042_04480 [Phycisphaeraceae bacterium]
MHSIEPALERHGRKEYVDLHALRMTLNTLMTANGVSQRIRQAHLRHADPRLTDTTYMDEALLPVAQQVAQMPPFGDLKRSDDGSPETHADTGGAQLPAQQTGGSGGPNEALPGEMGILITGYDGDPQAWRNC